MDPFLFCFCLGFLGFAVMTLLGFSHAHGHSHHGSGATHGHGAHSTHSPPHGAHSHIPFKFAGNGVKLLWIWLSPRVLFTLLIGFGGTGLLLAELLSKPIRIVLAVVGACLFRYWIVDPLWNFLFAFASAPARTLESTLLEEAEAVANFDSKGQGLVAVELDGQVVQMLGQLEHQECETGVRVRAGDRLMIVSVDPRRHRCTVVRSWPHY